MGLNRVLMLTLVVVTIMLGFPTAFTLMGIGVILAFLTIRSGQCLPVPQGRDRMSDHGVCSVPSASRVCVHVVTVFSHGYFAASASSISTPRPGLSLA